MKKALLVYGKPNSNEEGSHFEEFIENNLRIMSNIAIVSGYSPKVIPLSELSATFADCKKESDFLFYYTGHSEGVFLGNFYLEEIVDSIERLPGKKIIILDSCTDVFVERHNPLKNTTIAGCFDVCYNSPLSVSFYDAIIARGKKLDSITQKTFDEMKHDWVKVKTA